SGDKFEPIHTRDEPDETRPDWTRSQYETPREVQPQADEPSGLALPQLAGAAPPYTSSAAAPVHCQSWAGLVILIGTGITGAASLWRGLQRLSDHTLHPIWKGLSRFGGEVPMTVDAIERYLNMDAKSISGKMQIAQKWLVKPGGNFTAIK